jgi:hypothetical protein
MPAKKKPSITDIALRLLFSDLLDRGQVKPGDLGRILGYRDSTELSKFLKGNINFSRKRLSTTIETIISLFHANKTFIETGHGPMYAGLPYMNKDETPIFNDPGNIASYTSRQRITELEESLKKLQERNKQLEELMKAKEEIIKLQKQVIENLNQPPQAPGFRG